MLPATCEVSIASTVTVPEAAVLLIGVADTVTVLQHIEKCDRVRTGWQRRFGGVLDDLIGARLRDGYRITRAVHRCMRNGELRPHGRRYARRRIHEPHDGRRAQEAVTKASVAWNGPIRAIGLPFDGSRYCGRARVAARADAAGGNHHEEETRCPTRGYAPCLDLICAYRTEPLTGQGRKRYAAR